MYGKRTIVPCAHCGSDVAVRSYRARTGTPRYCNVQCAGAARIGKPILNRKPRRTTPAPTRFWAKVDKNGPIMRPELIPCWVWTGARSGKGYGKFGASSRRGMDAHRYSWTLHFGPISDGLWVLHHCDNPPCVRPEHLYIGTVLDNVRDMDSRGRRVCRPLVGDDHPLRINPALASRGEHINTAKLTADIVIEIRERYALGGVRQADLATEYGIRQTALGMIVTGRSWAHVGGPITRIGKGGNQGRRR